MGLWVEKCPHKTQIRPTKKGEQIICSPGITLAKRRWCVVGCYLPEFVALPADWPLALGMLT